MSKLMPLPDPLAVLQVASDYDISEEQAATAITWAAHVTVDAWREYADHWELHREDGDAMERWALSLGADTRQAVLTDAVTAVTGADQLLTEIYTSRRLPRVIRTGRPRLHIR